jgi:signal transduction histidine kinase/ActR/RegA family two-component response regulator
MSDEVAMQVRRLQREKNARKQAELLLEQKSLELYSANNELTDLANSLEEQIKVRTKELEEARDNALAASRSKTTFLSTMSHEIRTPMNGIIGMANLLLDTKLTHEQKNQASVILSSSESLLSIINDILDLSKLEAGKFEIFNRPFNLNELLLDIFNSMAITAANKNLQLLYYSDQGVPQDLVADPFRLRQILINLLGNSLKFTDTGYVELQVKLMKKEGDKVSIRFEIHDTGCGIDEESQKTLFTPFSQGKYDQTNPQGTGLGLSISRRLAVLMEGDVGLVSTLGKGSCFWIEMPMTIAESNQVEKRLDATYVMYEGNSQVHPAIQRQFDALGGELTQAKTIEELINWHSEDKKSFDRFIIDFESINYDQRLALYNHFQEVDDSENWLFIRRINEPTCPLTELIQQRGIDSFTKPITQDKFYEHLHKSAAVEDKSLDVSEDVVEKAWYEKVSGEDHHILLVDDNAVNRMVAAALLKKCGFTISTANDGLEAVEACEKTDFSLILMDIQMPRMGGIEAMLKIRELMKASGRVEPPMIALTANAMEGASEEYMSQGMDDYLTKPIDQDKLGKTLVHWLGQR